MKDFDNSMARLLRKREARQMHAVKIVVPATLEQGQGQVTDSEAGAVTQYNNGSRSRGSCANQEGDTEDLVVSSPKLPLSSNHLSRRYAVDRACHLSSTDG